MDCREFKKNHVAFVDDVLSAAEMRAMERHRSTCPRCARQDTMIRRSLLLVRNLPPIEPSPDFMARLNARLDLETTSPTEIVVSRPHLPSVAALTALAAGLVAAAYLAVESAQFFAPSSSVQPTAVMASVPALEPAPSLGNAAFVASVPTGMPVWPAVLMVGQAPMHFASFDFHESNAER